MSNVTLKHTPSKKTGTTDYTVQFLRCVSAVEQHTAEEYPDSISQEAIYRLNTR